jgi:hypothetical protein
MTSRVYLAMIAAIGAFLSLAPAADGQVFTPSYMAPRTAGDVGVYLSDGPGDFAIEGIWRTRQGRYDLGLRAGIADTYEMGILVGGELRYPISTNSPIDLALTGAAQGLIILDGDSGVGFGGGVTLGHTFDGGEISVTPYLHPRIAIVSGFGPDDVDLDLLADFGLDVRLSPSFDVRLGFGFGDWTADWGVGLAWR